MELSRIFTRWDTYTFKVIFLILFIISTIEFSGILILNYGKFVFTLDDPYIHLSLAEQIFNGEYGINPNHKSAPSSSILWPFILAPFAGLEIAPYIILFLNLSCALLTAYFATFFISQNLKKTPLLNTIRIQAYSLSSMLMPPPSPTTQILNLTPMRFQF